MKMKSVDRKMDGTHGSICTLPEDFFGYFGWPSIAGLDDGTLVVAASGMRNAHICPYGRTVVFFSDDEGNTWSGPRVVNDFPLDDRDAGVLNLGGDRLLISWFTSDTRILYSGRNKPVENPETKRRYEAALKSFTDAAAEKWLGSWIRLSGDRGETWGLPIKVAVTAPHGPVRLKNGDLFYLGKEFDPDMARFSEGFGNIRALRSKDGGKTWERLGAVPVFPETDPRNYHEPHVVEFSDGGLLGLIRLQNSGEDAEIEKLGLTNFSLMQTVSRDGGKSWGTAEPLGFHGSPPHLLRHSSDAIICAYGYRMQPWGQRVMISRDMGKSWEYDYILRSDGPDHDLGYPASVELSDGSILTIYYQKAGSEDEKCSLLWTRWNLPS